MSSLKILNSEECEKLVNYISRPNPNRPPNHRDIRNRLMCLLMLDTGLRCGEVVHLLVSDLNFNGQPVHALTIRAAITKTRCERTIPLTERLQDTIRKMIPLWLGNHLETGNYWAIASGPNKHRVSRRTVERVIKDAALTSIGKNIHPHMLRHTFACRLMRKTNIRVVQELLGHKSLTSTQIYTHPNNTDLTKAINSIEKGEASD